MHTLDAAVQATEFSDDLIQSLKRYTHVIAADMLKSQSRTQRDAAVTDAVSQVRAYRPTNRKSVKRLLKHALSNYFTEADRQKLRQANKNERHQ